MEAPARDRYWGHTDLPLSAEGLRQAEALRGRLAGERFDAIFASDLLRAKQTAERIACGHGMPVTFSPDLREINFGLCEGLTYAEIKERYPEADRFWVTGADALPFAGGESSADLVERVSRFRRECLPGYESVLVAGHGGPLSILICLLLELDPRFWWRVRLDIGSLSVVEVYPEGGILTLLNDTCHLQSA